MVVLGLDHPGGTRLGVEAGTAQQQAVPPPELARRAQLVARQQPIEPKYSPDARELLPSLPIYGPPVPVHTAIEARR